MIIKISITIIFNIGKFKTVMKLKLVVDPVYLTTKYHGQEIAFWRQDVKRDVTFGNVTYFERVYYFSSK